MLDLPPLDRYRPWPFVDGEISVRTGDPLVARRADCPKRMVYGPCGGVRPQGRCELDGRTCPFITEPAPRWPTDLSVERGSLHRRPDDGVQPMVLCDFRPPEPTIANARALARRYSGWVDTVLLGEHHERVDLPNTVLAELVLDEGVRPWVTMACRDRNSVALEADLAALAELGVAGVHCVTGDVRAPHVRPNSTPVFDLDSVRLTSLAHSFGLSVSVAESPCAEPVDQRPKRTADKYRAGASWCIVNLGVDIAELTDFVAAARREGALLRFAACVPVFTDAVGAGRLDLLPGVSLDEAEVAAVLGAIDPVQAGVDHAVRMARAVLAVDGVDGVNLSGPASTTSSEERAAIMRAVSEQLR